MLIMKSKLFTSIVNSNQSKIESAKTIRYPYLPTYSIRHDLNCENSCNHNVKDKDDDKHHIYGNDISTNSCILSSNSFQYLIIKVEIILDLEIKMLDEALRTIY